MSIASKQPINPFKSNQTMINGLRKRCYSEDAIVRILY